MKKFFVSLLAIVLVFGNLLSCNRGNNSGIGTDSLTEPQAGESEAPSETGEPSDSDVPESSGSENITPEPEPEPIKLELGGVSIVEYKIIYGNSDSLAAAEFLQSEILAATGEEVELYPDSEAKSKYEIIVGFTNRGPSPGTTEFYGYGIESYASKVLIGGYDKYALNAAARTFVDRLVDAGGKMKISEVDYTYSLPDREEYMEDIDKLYMRWMADWEPVEGMLDYEEKLETYINPGDRLLTCAHRADGDYYPENSIEAIISFYKMGGDVIEIDVSHTKDGVLILMHDNTLSRMTNSSDFRGKTVNGIKFPDSDNVADWTYEQISYLNLREGWGGNVPLTEFKVPTLVEVLKVCKNRLLILPDKATKWRYADINGIQESSPDYFLYDAMKEADNYESILLSYGYLTASEAIRLQKWLYSRTNVVPYIMLRENNNPKDAYDILLENAKPDSFAVQANGTFNPDTFPERYKDSYEYMKGKCLFLGWTISNEVDNSDVWDQMYDLGYRMIMTNDYLGLVKYAAKIYQKHNKADFRIDDVSVSDYRLVYGDEEGRVAAEFMRDEIYKASGKNLRVVSDTVNGSPLEIIIGTTKRGNAPECSEYYSYKAEIHNGKLYIGGCDTYALNNAALAVVDKIKENGGNASLSELTVSYTLPDREEYIEDIDKLYMRWIAEWQPDERMLDFEGKVEALERSTDRLITCSHRGDGYYYPENSIEGIISFYKMGGDVVELDIQVTKDGVPILMHDDDLIRMTNVKKFAGKTVNGVKFPDSYMVSDWTYEQIQYLNLRERWGYVNHSHGELTPVTPFKVATLVEALKVCKNRMFIIPDKTNKWRYTQNDCLTGSPNVYLFDAMKEANNYNSIILSYGLTLKSALAVQKAIYRESGVVAYMLPRDDTANDENLSYVYQKAFENSVGFQIGGDFVAEHKIAEQQGFKKWCGKVVVWGWTINNAGYYNDCYDIWAQMYELGYRMIMNNNNLELVKFAATTCNFD